MGLHKLFRSNVPVQPIDFAYPSVYPSVYVALRSLWHAICKRMCLNRLRGPSQVETNTATDSAAYPHVARCPTRAVVPLATRQVEAPVDAHVRPITNAN